MSTRAPRKRATTAKAPATEPTAVTDPTPSPAVSAGELALDAPAGRCAVRGCARPEVMDDARLCGFHWATRADLRKKVRQHD
ncbi:hypothetical protein [Prauserella flavalba]|uniref:hypothetical protein n=1 Tax=Prauserella flavalba TaxID=1477506 RepID=UPI0036E444AF